jgi:ElaB/YqjD/DUF883 family membrane-anchored ribosome-binding protein
MTDVQPEPTTSEATAAEKTAPAAVGPERRTWNGVTQNAGKAAALVKERSKVAGDYSSAHIRAHPLRSVAVALGAGLVLGALLLG